jgi:hypothetical protein
VAVKDPAVNELRGDPYATCVPGCSPKKHRPRYSPKQRKNFADNDEADEQISLFAIWNQAWRFALAMYVRPLQAAIAAASSTDGRILGIQSDSLNCACTHTHIPIYIHTNLYTSARLERRRKPAAAAWS